MKPITSVHRLWAMKVARRVIGGDSAIINGVVDSALCLAEQAISSGVVDGDDLLLFIRRAVEVEATRSHIRVVLMRKRTSVVIGFCARVRRNRELLVAA